MLSALLVFCIVVILVLWWCKLVAYLSAPTFLAVGSGPFLTFFRGHVRAWFILPAAWEYVEPTENPEVLPVRSRFAVKPRFRLRVCLIVDFKINIPFPAETLRTLLLPTFPSCTNLYAFYTDLSDLFDNVSDTIGHKPWQISVLSVSSIAFSLLAPEPLSLLAYNNSLRHPHAHINTAVTY